MDRRWRRHAETAATAFPSKGPSLSDLKSNLKSELIHGLIINLPAESRDKLTDGTSVSRLELWDHHRVQVPLLRDAPADLRQHLRPPGERGGRQPTLQLVQERRREAAVRQGLSHWTGLNQAQHMAAGSCKLEEDQKYAQALPCRSYPSIYT